MTSGTGTTAGSKTFDDIDITAHRSKHVNGLDGQHFDYVLTVCDKAKERGPVFFGTATRLHQNFNDPFVIEGDAFRNVREEVRSNLRGILREQESRKTGA